MHACSHVASSLFKNIYPRLNKLEYIFSLMIGLSVTKGSSSSVSSIAYFSLFVLIILWTLSYSFSSIELLLSIILSGLLLFIEQTCNKFLFVIVYFDLILSESKTCDMGICYVPVVFLFTGSTCELNSSSLIVHLSIYIARYNKLLVGSYVGLFRT